MTNDRQGHWAIAVLQAGMPLHCRKVRNSIRGPPAAARLAHGQQWNQPARGSPAPRAPHRAPHLLARRSQAHQSGDLRIVGLRVLLTGPTPRKLRPANGSTKNQNRRKMSSAPQYFDCHNSLYDNRLCAIGASIAIIRALAAASTDKLAGLTDRYRWLTRGGRRRAQKFGTARAPLPDDSLAAKTVTSSISLVRAAD